MFLVRVSPFFFVFLLVSSASIGHGDEFAHNQGRGLLGGLVNHGISGVGGGISRIGSGIVGLGGGVAGASNSRLSASQQQGSSSALSGASALDVADSEHVSGSKSSSSSSSKTSKIKQGSSFAVGNQNLDQNVFNANQQNQMNYGINSAHLGHHGFGQNNMGLSANSASNINAQNLHSNNNFATGSSNFESEQSESSSQSQSESFDKSRDHRLSAANKFAAAGQQFGRKDVLLDESNAFIAA